LILAKRPRRYEKVDKQVEVESKQNKTNEHFMAKNQNAATICRCEDAIFSIDVFFNHQYQF
jgi:hypothetical protein